jgi:O-antigen/teichoic acid export membrane protein
LKISNFNLGDPKSLARKLVAGTLGGVGARVSGAFVAFLVGLELARALGPTEYGSYGTVVAVTTMLTVLAQLGLPQLAIRRISVSVAEGALDEAKGTLIWFTASVLGASVLIAVTSAVVGIGWASEPNAFPMRAYYWGFASIPLLALRNLGVGLLLGYHRVVGAQLLDALFQPAIFAILLFVGSVLFVRFDAAGAIAMRTVSVLLTLGLCFWGVWRQTPSQVKRAKAVARWRAWAASAMPMNGTEIIRSIDSQYPILIFAAIAPLHDVGTFRVAFSIAVFAALPSGLINWAVMPHAAELRSAGDFRKLQMMATGSALALFACTLAATAALALIGKPAIVLAFGSAYRDSWLPLVVMSCAYTVSGFFGSTGAILNMTGHERAVTHAYVVGLVVGVALTLALYGLLGTTAAALAMVASELVKGGLMWRVARDRLSLDTSAFSAVRGFSSSSLFARAP